MDNFSNKKNDELDKLLDQQFNLAEWEEPSDEQVKKMEEFWFAQSTGNRSHWIKTISSIAAGLLILLTASYYYKINQDPAELTNVPLPEIKAPLKQDISIEQTNPVVKPDLQITNHEIKETEKRTNNSGDKKKTEISTKVPHETRKLASSKLAEQFQTRTQSRSPNSYETLLIQGQLNKRNDSSLQVQIQTVNQVLHEMADSPQGDLYQFAKPLLKNRSQYESLILNDLPKMEEKWQLASIRLLAVIGRDRSIPYLAHFMKNSNTRKESFKTFVKIAPDHLLSSLLPKLKNNFEQKTVCREFLNRNSHNSLNHYVIFVKNDLTNNAALSALSEVKNLNYDFFFTMLNSSLHSDQVAAAIILGRSNNTEVISRLVHLVTQHKHSRSAVVALLVSDHETATHFLERAIQSPNWSAEIHSAKSQLSTLTN